MQKMTPFLWFQADGKEVIDYYLGIFKDVKILTHEHYDDSPGGAVDVYTVEMLGMEFGLMSTKGPFEFNESTSFVIDCKDQEEVDYYWEKLTADGGQESMCGWLKDKYGFSWQITPTRLLELTQSQDKEASKRAFEAMMQMKKIIIKDLETAYKGD